MFAGTEMLSLSVYETIAIHILLGGPSPNLGEGVELEGRVWYPVKLLHIRYNLFGGTEVLSLRLRANRNTNFAWGTVPQFGGGAELRGRVWCPVKLLHINYNLFARTQMLSLSVYETIAMQILLWGPSPRFGGRGRV